MTIRLIAIDMDATLLREDKTYDKKAFNQAVTKLMNDGVVVCIATGNVAHKLVSYFDDELRDDLYLAADNGNYLFKGDELIHVNALPREEMNMALDHLDGRLGCYLSVSTGMTPYVLRQTLTPKVEKMFNIYFDYMEVVDSFDEIPEDLPIIKLAMFTDYGLDENKKLAKEFNELLPNGSSVTSGDLWMDIYNKTGGKGTAIAYLQEKYDISPDETIAFGDSMNDASMLERASYSVAVDNADPEVKNLCHYVIPSNEDQSVVKVLQALAENNSGEVLSPYKK